MIGRTWRIPMGQWLYCGLVVLRPGVHVSGSFGDPVLNAFLLRDAVFLSDPPLFSLSTHALLMAAGRGSCPRHRGPRLPLLPMLGAEKDPACRHRCGASSCVGVAAEGGVRPGGLCFNDCKSPFPANGERRGMRAMGSGGGG